MNNKCNTCAKQFTCNRKECKKVTFVQAKILDKPKKRKTILSRKNAKNLFNELGYSKIWCNEGFYYYNSTNNKTVLFNLKEKQWKVYDYDTLEYRGYGEELLEAILLQQFELKWLTLKEYEGEKQC